jgi:hypothetical protein
MELIKLPIDPYEILIKKNQKSKSNNF